MLFQDKEPELDTLGEAGKAHRYRIGWGLTLRGLDTEEQRYQILYLLVCIHPRLFTGKTYSRVSSRLSRNSFVEEQRCQILLVLGLHPHGSQYLVSSELTP